jgi:hypothetical protein
MQLLPELLHQYVLPGLRYAELQRLRGTCRSAQALPCTAHLNALARAFRARRRRHIWGQWRALLRGQWLTDRRCHRCWGPLDLPQLFEMRVELDADAYAVYFAFCSGCWSDLCRRWPGPFTHPSGWTCEQTQDFVQRAAERELPRPEPASLPCPSAADALRSTVPSWSD